jgi:hypothetical protein
VDKNGRGHFKSHRNLYSADGLAGLDKVITRTANK